jgi:thymidylate synthase
MDNNPNYIMREYDIALHDILLNGFDINDERTGHGTTTLFGISTKYDVSQRVPIMTKRKVFWKSIVKEVLWYISGSHRITDLEAMGSNIWTPWKNDEFTDAHELPQGSGGYIYGFNLIHFGGNIEDYDAGKDTGFNQLDYVINTLRDNPGSRQACFTFWRPDTNEDAVLPACHAFYSFIVSPDENGDMKDLNCHIFQRSNDYPIGVGYGNLITGTLFMYMIAQQLGMKPKTLFHTGSHCHIYNNALAATAEYCYRDFTPSSPILQLNHKPSIYDYIIDDFELVGYHPLDGIKFPIAI